MISKPLFKIFSIIIFFTFAISSFAGSHTITRNTHMTSGNILYVGGNGPGNYTNITNAYLDTVNGDIIYVFPGIYDEGQLQINKSISIIGEDKWSTILNATYFYLLTNNITIHSFTFTRGYLGISDNYYDNGYHKIINNVFNQSFAIGLEFSNHNLIADNAFLNCGLILPFIENEPITITNTIVNNSINGQPLIYFEDEKDKIIENAGQIILLRCNNITIENFTIYDKFIIWTQISTSNNITIKSSKFYDHIIWIHHSKNCMIKSNNLNQNSMLVLYYNCSGNKIFKNVFKCDFPLFIEQSSNNIFYQNDFLKKFRIIGFSDIMSFNSHNLWHNNYYGRPRILPKLIWVIHSNSNPPYGFWSLDIDFRPAIMPNNISKIKISNDKYHYTIDEPFQSEILKKVVPNLFRCMPILIPQNFFWESS